MLRDYVTGADHRQYANLPDGVVLVLVTHSNLTSKYLDIRFDLHTTVEGVKEKLRTHYGTSVQHQKLIHKVDGVMVQELSDNSKMLGFYSVNSGEEIHCIDTDPFSLSRGGGLQDTTLIEKYKMSDEKYEARKGTLRDWIKEQRKKDPNFKLKPKGMQMGMGGPMVPQQEVAPVEIPGPESVAGIEVGMRCQVMPGKRRGEVKFVGDIAELKDGPWVGVQLDEPLGINDGKVKGRQVFECPDKFGSFVRGKNVKVGDFPVKDLMDESDSDEEGDGDENATPNAEEDEDEI